MTMTLPEIRSRGDVLMIAKLMANPNWQVPKNVEIALPQALSEIITSKTESGEYKYSERSRLRAIETLKEMVCEVVENESGGPEPDRHLHLHLEGKTDAEIEMMLDRLSPDQLEVIQQFYEIKRQLASGESTDGSGAIDRESEDG